MLDKVLIKNKVATIFLLVLLILGAYISVADKSFAITTEKTPNNSTFVPSSYKFVMGSSNAEIFINPNASSYLQLKTGSPTEIVAIYRTLGARTLYDPIEINYKNAGEINGRKVNVQLHVNWLSFSSKSNTNFSNTSVVNCDGAVITMWSNETHLASYRTTSTRYKITHNFDISFYITYADTGEPVNLPCFQAVTDLDTFQNVSKVAEGFVPMTGYTKAYIYPGTYLSQHSSGFFAPSQSPVSGNDSYIKAGLYAATANGTFRGRYYCTNCRTQLMLYNQYKEGVLSKPTLDVDTSKVYHPNDEIILNVNQKIGKFFYDTINEYGNFVISNKIPDGLTYKSAKVLNAAGTDITSNGTLNYDPSTRVVSFTFSSSFLNTKANYDGSIYKLAITTTADPLASGDRLIDNIGESNISGIIQDTNMKQIRVAVPYTVSYRYESSTNSKKLPTEISTESGAYKVSDTNIYYKGDTVTRNAEPKDGTIYGIYDNEGNHKGNWVLTWNANSFSVVDKNVEFIGTWRYVPVPRIQIVKKIKLSEEQFTEAHGDLTFIFKIRGTKTSDTWYRQITFTKNVLEQLKTNPIYTENGLQFTIKDGYIYGMCLPIYVPEDDYDITELTSMRFAKVTSRADYHNDNTAVLISNAGSSIKVPLNLSLYKEGERGYNADYASVVFDNSKTNWSKCSHSDIIINKLRGVE